MAELASKRPGRPRKVVDDAKDSREVSVNPANDTGNGEASGNRLESQKESAAARLRRAALIHNRLMSGGSFVVRK